VDEASVGALARHPLLDERLVLIVEGDGVVGVGERLLVDAIR
jgi:hypothetical protein